MAFRALAAGAVLFACSYTGAGAGIVHTITVDDNSLLAGDLAALHLTINLSADSGYYNPSFTSGAVTIFSGNGQQQSFSLPSGGTLAAFSASFTYSQAGSFSPYYSFDLNYRENYDRYEYLYSSTNYYFSHYEYYSYSCGFFSTCYRSYPVYRTVYEPVYGNVTRQAQFNVSGSGSLDLTVSDPSVAAAAPEPTTWAMMLIGFAGLAYTFGRKEASGKAKLRTA